MIAAVLRYKYSLLYFLSIVGTNALYSTLGSAVLWPTPWGAATWSPLAVVVGFWFILRDYAQEELGSRVLYVMVAGMIASYLAAGPELAIASAVAFAVGELVDFSIYTFSKRPFAQRVLISSLCAAPVDTFLFFATADFMHLIPGVQMLSWPTVTTETISKIAAAAFVYQRIKSRTTIIAGHSVA